MKKLVLAIAALAVVGWLAWPYVATYRVIRAINTGDTVTLEQKVDWPKVRQGIKDDIQDAMERSGRSQEVADNPFAAALIPAMIDKLVGAITPLSLSELMKDPTTKIGEHPQGTEKLTLRNVDYAFFSGLQFFLVVLSKPSSADVSPISLLMQFEDADWKVTRIYLPVDKAFEKGPSSLARQERIIAQTESDSSEATKTDPAASANAAYRSKVKLYDLHANYFDSVLDGKVPGVTFKLKNEGDRALKRVEVRVFFKDAQGKAISEESYTPVLVSKYSFGNNSGPLKPGYIWQIERGKFYVAKYVPSEWEEGSAVAQVTKVEIGDE